MPDLNSSVDQETADQLEKIFQEQNVKSSNPEPVDQTLNNELEKIYQSQKNQKPFVSNQSVPLSDKEQQKQNLKEQFFSQANPLLSTAISGVKNWFTGTKGDKEGKYGEFPEMKDIFND